jgi:hypothetical protein
VFALALIFDGGFQGVAVELGRARPALFWLFLGGFCWVLGDLFQQYAAKYIGISRGIPLSNTNQLWGLAWGALVFGELSGRGFSVQALVIGGSILMIAGAAAISTAEASQNEQAAWKRAMDRECGRYSLDAARVEATVRGEDPLALEKTGRRWWEFLIAVAALAVFVWLAMGATRQPVAANLLWMAAILAATLVFLVLGGVLLWKRTRFS